MKNVYRKLVYSLVLGASLMAYAEDWSAWDTCDADNELSVRTKLSSHNGYSNQCDWFVQIQNNHSWTADIHYGASSQAGQVQADHTSLNTRPGASVSVVLTVPCSGSIYVGARGTQSTR